MNKLRIPENHSGVSKTLRLPENIVEDIQIYKILLISKTYLLIKL